MDILTGVVLHERALRDLGESQAAVFAGHLGLLKDEKLLNRVRGFVKRDLVNVEQALHDEVSSRGGRLKLKRRYDCRMSAGFLVLW